MKKGYWVSLYYKVENQENLKKYAQIVTPIIKSFGGVPLIRGGDHETFEGEDFIIEDINNAPLLPFFYQLKESLA